VCTLQVDVNDVNILSGMTAIESARPYHHGDLRRALVAAATELASADGPDGVALREAARRVGVSPSAAYRHFPSREGLLAVIASAAREDLARRMLDAMAAATDGAGQARERFRACGREYVRFALEEPGLFAVAFRPCPPGVYVPDDPSPYAVLSGSLDELDAAGLLAVPRAGAEEYAWAAVHGAAVLLGSGAIPPADRDRVIEGTLAMVADGLLRARKPRLRRGGRSGRAG
jgi:AcrR family transcriptional regulator